MQPDEHVPPDRRELPAQRYPVAAGTLAGILARIREVRAQRTPAVLCLVAQTEGSTYRKAGALSLVTPGQRNGVISGGCLESDLELHAHRVLDAGEPRCVVFDTQGDDDLLFGYGSGCRGRMHVLMLPDRAPHDALFDALLEADARHVPLDLAVCLDGPGVGRGLCWSGTFDVSLGSRFDTPAEVRTAPLGTHEFAHASVTTRVARVRIGTVPRVLVIGAGPEAAPLLEIARCLGWRSVLIDHRPAAVGSLAALADEAIVATPADGLTRRFPVPIDACVIMTHTAAHDLAALRAVQSLPVRYVGLLGPAGRRDDLLGLLEGAERVALEGRLRAPVGLKLGAQGPEALALAIAAELQRFFAEPA